MSHRIVGRRTSLLAFVAVMTLTGCGGGGGLSGTYTGEDGMFDSLTFKSGGKVEIVFMGMTSEIEFAREGDTVKFTNDGQTSIFAIDDKGCLVGGGLLGTYCKKE